MRTLMTAIALVTAAGLAVAQPAHNCAGCPSARPKMAMASGVAPVDAPADMPVMPELTAEQQDRMYAARQNHLRAVLPIQTDLEIKEMDLGALWRADKFDAKKITGKVREISELRGRLELERVNHMIAMRELLTPEQRKSFRPGMGMGRGGHKGMMRGMRGMRGMGGCRPMMGKGHGPTGCGGDCGGKCGSD